MIYLDNAATSFPKPKGMIEKMSDHQLAWCGNPGRAGHALSRKTTEAIADARAVLADFFNIDDPERIIFTKNATEALNLAILGTAGKGDHVITTSMEHNSVLRPITASGAEYTIVQCRSDGVLDPDNIEKEIHSNTRLVVCTNASNVTGTLMPVHRLADICRRHHILLLVDASQTAGHMPVTADDFDMVAMPGHKGLMGPMGTGLLITKVRPGPLLYGGTGTMSKVLKPPVELPQSYEAGTLNAPGIIGLGYSADWIRRYGISHIYEHQMALTRMFDEQLRNMPGVEVYGPAVYRNKVGITAFNIRGRDSEEVASSLNDEFGIAVRAGFHCAGLAHKTIGTWDTGAVRVSAGIFTTRSQMQYAADMIYRIAKTASGVRPSRYSPVHPRGCSSR